MPDSNEWFTTSNSGISTTSAIEYMFVMKAMGISVPASKSLQDFLEIGGKGAEGWLTRAEVIRRDGLGRPVVLDGVTRKIRRGEAGGITSHGQTVGKVLVTETRCCRQRVGQVPAESRASTRGPPRRVSHCILRRVR